MSSLNLIRVLEYYDVPQLLIAADAIGVHYLCMLLDIESNGDLMFIGVRVSKTKLNDFIKGHIDLRSVFENPEMENSLYSVCMSGEKINAEIYTGTIDETKLPDENYFYDDSSNEDEEMIERAAESGKTIIRLAFQTPQNHHDIDVRCLTVALQSFQSLVDNSYRRLYREERQSNSLLRVTTFMAASFDVELMTNEDIDMFGQTKVGQTLNVISNLFSSNTEDVIDTLRELKGYAASSYKKFLEVLLDNDMSLRLKWVYDIQGSEVRQNDINRQRVQNLHEFVTSNSDLEIEDITLNGCFLAANTSSGSWTFQPTEGRKINGDSDDSALLTGVTLKDRSYSIICRTKQSLNEATSRETIKYTLVQLNSI